MGGTRVTQKFQITIPKDVREAIGLKPGEILIVEPTAEGDLRVRRTRVKEPLRILIGERKFRRHVPVEEVEEKVESE